MNKALEQHRVYRVSENKDLLSTNVFREDWHKETISGDIFKNALFFSTSKKQALGFNSKTKDRKTVLMEMKSMDFISELLKNHSDIKIVMLNRDDIAAYEKFFHNTIISENTKLEFENFIANRTYDINSVSIRKLRSSIEIIVVLPEEINSLSFNADKIKKTGLEYEVSTDDQAYYNSIIRYLYKKTYGASIKTIQNRVKKTKNKIRIFEGEIADIVLQDKNYRLNNDFIEKSKQKKELEEKLEKLKDKIQERMSEII